MLLLRTLAALAGAASASATAWRGANSWYSWLGAPNDTQAIAAATYMSNNLLAFGYNTFTLDEGWAEKDGQLFLDANGRLTWNPEMFPSGIPHLASTFKSLGIDLGLWLVRGVPRAAVQEKLPIFGGGGLTAADAVRLDRNCSWDAQTFGSNAPSAAATAYYTSIAQQIASWGVSLVKIDCLWPNKVEGTPQTYFDEDVEAMTDAFRAAGLSLSLSPGISVSPQNGSWIAAGGRADFYRIAEDVLDVYDSKADGSFPQGVRQKFAKALEFEALLGLNKTTPDFDMLMLGRTIHGYDSHELPPTETHLTRDEQLTEFTLFAFTGMPLIMGGFLPLDDSANSSWTLSILTNAEILGVQSGGLSRASFAPVGAGAGNEFYGWVSTPAGATTPTTTRYVALFNAEEGPRTVGARFVEDLGLPAGTTAVCLRDLWAHSWTEPAGGPLAGGGIGFNAGVNAHGARAFVVAPVGGEDCRVPFA
jgi:alpha-galactosidase